MVYVGFYDPLLEKLIIAIIIVALRKDSGVVSISATCTSAAYSAALMFMIINRRTIAVRDRPPYKLPLASVSIIVSLTRLIFPVFVLLLGISLLCSQELFIVHNK